MPDTRGRPLANEILPLLKDASITNWLRDFIIQQSSVMSIGRFPGNGSAQDDQYVYPDDADGTFAYNFDYVIPSNFQRLVSAKLSFKIRPFRSYNNFSATSTGATTPLTDSSAESGHSHSHAHTVLNDSGISVALGATGELYNTVAGTNPQVQFANANSGTIISDTNAAGSSGHSHAHNHQSHTHTLTITSTLGIFEDVAPVNPGITVKVDGVDKTAQLSPAGPYQTDQVELDVTNVLAQATKIWHTVSLQPNQRVRITGILRISYYIDSRLAQ